MDLNISVKNQVLRYSGDIKKLVAGTQNFIRFVFEFNSQDPWDNMTVFAQFKQGDKTYTYLLDNNNSAPLPPEIETGICEVSLQGTSLNEIAIASGLSFPVIKNPIIEDEESTGFSPTLYQQLLGMVSEVSEKGIDAVGIEEGYVPMADGEGNWEWSEPKECEVTKEYVDDAIDDVEGDIATVQQGLNAKQNTLVSGTNIKTVNGSSLLGSGNLTIQGEVTEAEVTELREDLANLNGLVGVLDAGTTYTDLNPSTSRMTVYFPLDEDNINKKFCYHITDKGTNNTLQIRITSSMSPYGSSLLQVIDSLSANEVEKRGVFLIKDNIKENAKYIAVLCTVANAVVPFTLRLWTDDSLSSDVNDNSKRIDGIVKSTTFTFADFEQGGINGSTGASAPSNGTVRTSKIKVKSINCISMISSNIYHVQMYSYNSDGVYLGRNDFGINSFKYTSDDIYAYRSAETVIFAIYLVAGGNLSPSTVISNNAVDISIFTLSTISDMNKNTGTDFSKMLSSAGNTPMATWIDDDGNISGITNNIMPVVNHCDIPITFAVIPPLSDSEFFKEKQKSGHHITVHPPHETWYGTGYNLKSAERTLIESMSSLTTDGFIHSDLLVYPGSSSNNNDVVEMVKKWCICGVKAGYGTPNHLADDTKWQIKRVFINFSDYDSMHSGDSGYTNALDWYKSQIDSAYNNGDWIVFGTHSYQFTNSEDTSNPNENTVGNLKLLMDYVKSKGIKFHTLYDAYNRRRYLYDFKEMNI